MHTNSLCYCGRSKPYSLCCEPIHQNIFKAKTAEDLMRSRYSAYVIANGDFLMQSHHSTTRPKQELEEIIKWSKSVKWTKLEVLSFKNGLEEDNFGTVEFKAFFKEKKKQNEIHENSEFIRENGHWVYLGYASY